MKVTNIAIVPPPALADAPKLTPELLASVFARYSRSNEGLDAILSKVDLENPDASIDRILKFVDYGHASIAGLTGGLAVAIDGISMWLAYKLFEIAQMADGQESSTRYISMSPESLPDAPSVDVPQDLTEEWRSVMADCYKVYDENYRKLDVLIAKEPERVRLPSGASPAMAERMRKNFALDRARYFIPLATRTNVALVQTARMWSDTIKYLDSLKQKEATSLAAALYSKLSKQAPRLLKHSLSDQSYRSQANFEHLVSCQMGFMDLSMSPRPDRVWVKIDEVGPGFFHVEQSFSEAMRMRVNRYGRQGLRLRRMRVTFAWNNVAIAELRDLNRHRTGHRYSPLIQAGFYTPPDIELSTFAYEVLGRQTRLMHKLLERESPTYVYGLLLGSQTPFEHTTTGDKFIYEAELRTGLGAHFRYAEHLHAALAEFYQQAPAAKDWVFEGQAEPE